CVLWRTFLATKRCLMPSVTVKTFTQQPQQKSWECLLIRYQVSSVAVQKR
ncbi:DNA polymerase A family protein, partial [Vibrio parahaemolyticus V-223/04]